MTHEEFKKELENIPNEELASMAHSALSKLCSTGGKSFTMTVPPRKDDTDMIFSEIITRFEKTLSQEFIEKWEVESVDRYWYWSSRNGKTYIEITYWFEPHTLQRKETKRSVDNHYGDHYSLPDWAKSITENRKSLNDDRVW